MNNIKRLKTLINESRNIVFFGGAGVSTESNIPDFRSANGLYNEKEDINYPPETILSHSFFIEHTLDFYKFYREKMIYKDAKPNEAHIALRELEKSGKLNAIITQNIDGLHQQASSGNVLELHGSVLRNYCVSCNLKYNLEYILNSEEIVPRCKVCGGVVRPDVVLYEESLNMEVLYKAIDYIEKSDMLIVGGTSLLVYPAASLIKYYKGNKLILINKQATSYDNIANLTINENIAEVFNECVLK